MLTSAGGCAGHRRWRDGMALIPPRPLSRMALKRGRWSIPHVFDLDEHTKCYE
jgi:hypothetical protein